MSKSGEIIWTIKAKMRKQKENNAMKSPPGEKLVSFYDAGTPEFFENIKGKKIVAVQSRDGDFLLRLSDQSAIVFFHSECDAGLYWQSELTGETK